MLQLVKMLKYLQFIDIYKIKKPEQEDLIKLTLRTA